MALLKFKRSAVPAKVPSIADLDLGELAINTYDGKVYTKKDDGTQAIVEIGGGGGTGTVTSVAASGGTTGLTFTGSPITTSGTLTLGGTLAVANGGTGATSLTSGYLVKGNGISAVSASVVYDDGTNVGIGIIPSSARLEVDGTTASPLILSRDGGTDANTSIRWKQATTSWYTGVNASNTFAMRYNNPDLTLSSFAITSAGNVGINTTTPNANLGAYTGMSIAGSNAGLQLQGSSFSSVLFGDAANVGIGSLVYDHSVDALRTFVNNTERMRIDASGNVGIGTTAPNANLEISGSTEQTVQITSALNGSAVTPRASKLSFRSGTARVETARISSFNRFTNFNGGNLEFATADTSNVLQTRAVIDSSGNVGIGSTSPTNISGYTSLKINNATNGAILDLAQGDTYRGRLVGTAAAFAIETNTGLPIVFSPTGVERGRFDTSGNFLIGTTATINAAKMLVQFTSANNGLYLDETSNTSGTQYMRFSQSGTVSGSITRVGTTAAVAYNTSSDVRLKHDIVDAPEASSLIDAIQVRSFKWNSDNSEQRYGFIAQELITVAPEAVSQPADPDQMMGVDYSKLVPMLVKELQSLRARVAELEGNQA